MEKRILFICKYNRFRSRIAESLFKKLNKNKNIKVKSAGIFQGHYPLNKIQVKLAKKLGIQLSGRPKGINVDLLRWQNTTVIVADDVPESIFNNEKHGKKTIVWKIPDSKTSSEEEIKGIILLIKNKIVKLIQNDKQKSF